MTPLKNTLKIPPIFLALIVQFAVYALMSLVLPAIQETVGYSVPLFWRMLLQGLLAAMVTYWVLHSSWWVIIQLLAPPFLVLGLALDIPAWVFPVLLIFLMMIFWNVAINRVPLYLSNKQTVAKLNTVIKKQAGMKVVDLGSGLGGTMTELAKTRSNQQFYGFETAPMPFLVSWVVSKMTRQKNTTFFLKSFWNINLAEYDVIYCFLSPVPMAALYEKAVREMKPGSWFISNSFTVPGHKPDRTLTVADSRKTKLMIWKI